MLYEKGMTDEWKRQQRNWHFDVLPVKRTAKKLKESSQRCGAVATENFGRLLTHPTGIFGLYGDLRRICAGQILLQKCCCHLASRFLRG
jgi:hypothetical protein